MADLKEKTYVEDVDRSVYDIRDAENDAYRMESGLTPEIVEKLSQEKSDPACMQQFRLESLQIYIELKLPNCSPSIEGLDMIDDVKKYELLTRLESMPKHVKLCHGEFTPENIIINDEGDFVVDWLKAKLGNASADVAKTYLWFCLNHHTEYAEKYLKLYCKKTGTAIKYVQDWLPIVAAAQLKFKRPEERELLLTWIDIADYD